MYNSKVAMRYAEALFIISKENNNLKQILDELEQISDIVKKSIELRNLIKSPIISDIKKEKLFFEIFQGKVSDITFRFLILLINKRRINLIEYIYISFVKLYNIDNGLIPITIRSAIELTDELKSNIISKVETVTSKKVIPNYVVDKTLIGGITIDINNCIYDASLKHKLDRVHNFLIKNI